MRQTEATTIRDVAKACGVSAMTVSAVLNGRPGFASTETRDRVLRTAREMRYQPNAIARGLTRRRMNTLGVVMSYEGRLSLTSDRYFGPILDGIFTASKDRRQKTLIVTESTWEDAEQHLPAYLDGHCDGLIFILPILPSDAFRPLVQRQFPFALIGENRPEAGLSTVDMDNVRAARDLTNHLLDLGHRRIALLCGDSFLLSASERATGYRGALRERGVSCEERTIVAGSYSEGSGYERARALLTLPEGERPTALLCGDDWIALGALRAAADLGRRVPGDVSIAGFNDDREAAAARPGLTTVRQPFRLLGERAIATVLGQISQRADAGKKILIPGELIVRETTAPPPSIVRHHSPNNEVNHGSPQCTAALRSERG